MAKQQNLIFQIIGKKFDVISTVDHPYTSPPIHLFDAHLNLLQKYGSNVLILNWDVSLPGERTYRYDLITDTGLIAKSPNLYHYELGISYCNQHFNLESWKLLPQYIEIAIKTIGEKYHLSQIARQQIQHRAFNTLDLAKKSYQNEPWSYTRNLLINFYLLFNRPELSAFIEQQYINYWLSPFMTKWIPWCILNVDGSLSLHHLLENKIFLRNPFRIVNQKNPDHIEIQDSFILAKKISEGAIIPSFDIFLWSLAIAGIKHYGNDFGFFQKLSNITGIKTIADLQLTKYGEDAMRFLGLATDYGVLFDNNSNKITVSNNPYHLSKITRINSFSSLYVIGGDDTVNYLKGYSKYLNSGKIINLS